MSAKPSRVLALVLSLAAGSAQAAPAAKDGRKSAAKPTKPAAPRARPRENPYLEVPDRAFAESTLAFRHANRSEEDALAELDRRNIAWVQATPPLPGVRTPIRLMGPLHGVTIHSMLSEAARLTSVYEILDARLALALDDFCALLQKHDIVEIVHFTMYRPPAGMTPDPQKQIRHPAGLAIDVGMFKKRDGRSLAIKPHWPSAVGEKTCGDGAREHSEKEARELVSIVCEATDQRIFHFMLTPDFDAAHADHVHLEIKPGARWFIVN